MKLYLIARLALVELGATWHKAWCRDLRCRCWWER